MLLSLQLFLFCLDPFALTPGAQAECSNMRRGKVGRYRQPAIWFRRREDGKSSLSKLGGRPTLLPDIEWPQHGHAGTPMHFLAQIDLSALPAMPLYRKGMPDI
jgi:hypothetical protein